MRIFSEDTFPAVPAQEAAVIHLLRVREGLPEHRQPDEITFLRHDRLLPRPRGASALRKIARRVS